MPDHAPVYEKVLPVTLEPLPERPKGMHLETYMKLFWEHHEAEMEHLAGMRERLANMRERLDKLEKRVG